ncbi:hypothetical protein PHMEG_0005653 [Phytophthora megakarya]|uniref:Reverse transcriptase n=1 Tax=Phytophthora megakarya TaxID=4795 RepID=A0A225WQX4_9STRA|nr:hypothetical protein PHMEG_0005653 [Phytophthora megakarya]
MDHSAGSEVMLGPDFMIPAGIRLDLFNLTAKLPGEEVVPMVKSSSADEDTAEGMHVTGGPTKNLQIPAAHLNVIAWVPRGFMPKEAGYVSIDYWKYEQWQVLAYAGSHDETWFKLECELYEQWLVSQPPGVERQPYTWPTSILQKPDEYSSDGEDSISQDKPWSTEPVSRSVDIVTDSSPVDDDPSPTETPSDERSSDSAVADLEHTLICVMHVLSTEGNDDPADDDYAVHEVNYISLEDYAQELPVLPDLTEPSVAELDDTALNVKNPSLAGDQQRQLDDVARPSKQRAMRIPLGHIQKRYELLKELLKAGLTTSSDSPWTSPIVIELKKNGQDIRLCIDYKMINAVTAIMEYAMPLVDDRLTELARYFVTKWVNT